MTEASIQAPLFPTIKMLTPTLLVKARAIHRFLLIISVPSPLSRSFLDLLYGAPILHYRSDSYEITCIGAFLSPSHRNKSWHRGCASGRRRCLPGRTYKNLIRNLNKWGRGERGHTKETECVNGRDNSKHEQPRARQRRRLVLRAWQACFSGG